MNMIASMNRLATSKVAIGVEERCDLHRPAVEEHSGLHQPGEMGRPGRV